MKTEWIAEPVEPRRLLTAEPLITLHPDGELEVVGTFLSEIILVERVGAEVVLHVNTLRVGFDANRVTRLSIGGYEQADTITNATDLPAFINGGPGDDTILGGTGRDTILGEFGNDSLDGGFGDDEIYGGTGLDIVHYRSHQPGSFTFNQLRGFELDPFEVLTGDWRDTVAADVETLSASDGPDFIQAVLSAEIVIDGGGGDDRIATFYNGTFTLPLHTVFGGEGNDTLAISDDEIVAAMWGGPGDDIFFDAYGFASDEPTIFTKMIGGPGNDTVFIDGKGVVSNYVIPPGVENLVHMGGPVGTRIVGNELNNRITVVDMFAPVTVLGMGGDDTIIGSDYNDVIYGGPGRDRLEGGDGDDSLFGGDGGDLLLGGFGNDSYDPGGGRDIIFDIDNHTPAADLFALNPRDRGFDRAQRDKADMLDMTASARGSI